MNDEGLRNKIHLRMLTKSQNAMTAGNLTVVMLGYAVDVAIELLKEQDSHTQQIALEARVDELERAMNEYGLPEGVSFNSTPVVTYEAIKKRLNTLKQAQNTNGDLVGGMK